MSKSNEELMKELMDELSRPENIETLKRIVQILPKLGEVIEPLKEMIDSGTLDTLFRIACLINTFRNMITDEMIAGFSTLGSSALELLAKTKSPIVQKGLSAVVDHPIEFEKELEKTEIKGLLGLIKLLRDEEFLKGLTVVVAMLKLIGRHWSDAN